MMIEYENSQSYEGAVKKLIENALPFYQGEEREVKKDEATLALYEDAVQETEGWLRKVLERDILENGYDSASATLYLPSGNLPVISTVAAVKSKGVLFFESTRGGEAEKFHTPIGEFDQYTYNTIILEADNPVRLLFGYFDNIRIAMMASLSHILYEQNQVLLTREALKEYKWYDVLGLHRMMYGSLEEVLPKH